MAIEFHCPYCTAAIRVADQYSGKKGSCPKCGTKLIVPDVVPPQPAAPTPEPAAPNSTVPTTPPVTPPSTATNDAAGFPVSPQAPAEWLVPDAAATAPPSADNVDQVPQVVTSSATTSSLSRRLRRKSRRQQSKRLYSVGIPAVCFLLFVAAIVGINVLRTPELKGTLLASVAANMEIPDASVAISSLGLTQDETAQAGLAFENSPEAFNSSRLSCRVSVEAASLVVEIAAVGGHAWFAVNPVTDLNLSDWIRDNTPTLNPMRIASMNAAGYELCKDKILKSSGVPVVFDAERYRDDFGFGSHVGAFGYVVEAVTGNTRSLCAHEDTNGTLYFCLPSDTTSFTLRGRRLGGTNALFHGEYLVNVQPNSSASATTESPETPEEADTPEAMPGNDGMSEPTTTDSMDDAPMSNPAESDSPAP